MAKEFIVAIELGSSKITGVAGRKNSDGSITVLAAVREDASSCIRKGVVYNVDKTVQCLKNIKERLKQSLKTEISQVYVGVGGLSLHGVNNVIIKDLASSTIVSQEMVDELKDKNRAMLYPDYKIVDAVPQEYKVDSQIQVDPVGVMSTRIEGNFLNILWHSSFYSSLELCFDKAGIRIADPFVAPLKLAGCVLTESERRSGCLLVDMGAETTTVMVYYRNILRYLSVLPLGGDNVTKDIASLQIDDKEAEELKLKYASAYTENGEIDESLDYSLGDGRTVKSRDFIDIVESRVAEIVENVWNLVPAEYKNKLVGGIVLTGGGACMPNMDKVFARETKVEKIRLATFVTMEVTPAKQKVVITHDGTMNTVIGLLDSGKENCAGRSLDGGLFADGQEGGSGNAPSGQQPGDTPTPGGGNDSGQQPGGQGNDGNSSKDDGQNAEPETPVEPEGEKKTSFWSRAKTSLTKFLSTLSAPEEETHQV